jgi:hypothetical protein
LFSLHVLASSPASEFLMRTAIGVAIIRNRREELKGRNCTQIFCKFSHWKIWPIVQLP